MKTNEQNDRFQCRHQFVRYEYPRKYTQTATIAYFGESYVVKSINDIIKGSN